MPRLSDLHGAALVAALEARFEIVTATVKIGDGQLDVSRPRSAEALISEEDFARDERLPYWADLWGSAVVLARRLGAERGHGRTLLELGSGLGLVTAIAMAAGYRVTASDYYEDALAFTRANAWRLLGREPMTRLVDWRAPPDDLGRFHRLVAADVLYERPYGELVARAIAGTLAPGGEATVADPGRVGRAGFLGACRALGLVITHEEGERCEDGPIRQDINLYTLRWPEPSPPPVSGPRALDTP